MTAIPRGLVTAAACVLTLVSSEASAATDEPARTAPQPSTVTQAPPHPAIGAPAPGARAGAKAKAEPVKKVDINNASLAELKTLPTVGDAEAKAIVAHRPYRSKGELVTKAGLPEGVYLAVKRRVELQAPRKAVAKK